MLTFDYIEWDDENNPSGNAAHVGRHGLATGEVDDVLASPALAHGFSRSSNRPCVWGRTSGGKHVIVIYDEYVRAGLTFIRPKAAYEVPTR